MYFYQKARESVLVDLLAIHTNRLTQLMIKGETYPGEYNSCKRTIQLIQREIIYKGQIDLNTVLSKDPFNQSTGSSKQN